MQVCAVRRFPAMDGPGFLGRKASAAVVFAIPPVSGGPSYCDCATVWPECLAAHFLLGIGNALWSLSATNLAAISRKECNRCLGRQGGSTNNIHDCRSRFFIFGDGRRA